MHQELRELLGQEVRLVWTDWARQQDKPKPSWLQPWSELGEPDREVDRQIGERLFRMGEAFALTMDSCQNPTKKLVDAINQAQRNAHSIPLKLD